MGYQDPSLEKSALCGVAQQPVSIVHWYEDSLEARVQSRNTDTISILCYNRCVVYKIKINILDVQFQIFN